MVALPKVSYSKPVLPPAKQPRSEEQLRRDRWALIIVTALVALLVLLVTLFGGDAPPTTLDNYPPWMLY
ncbi:MAG: hypothetical protein KDA42_03640 [Planctomycetales bacterium]|nr:hypothetical protein [Planctomycetales bacterium]